MTEFDAAVLEHIDCAAKARVLSSLARTFKVPKITMSESLERLIKAGRVKKIQGELKLLFVSIKNNPEKLLIIPQKFKPLIYNVTMLGNRPGSNDYREWPSRHLSGEIK